MPNAIDKKAEVHFLVDTFDIPPIRAADLIADEQGEAQDLAMAVEQDEHAKNPLEGLPLPGPTKDADHIEQGAEDLEKPVAHRDSAPT